jgi:hypothetical protein
MKNLALAIFILYFCVITCENTNLKNQSTNESQQNFLTFYNYAYVKSSAIAARRYRNKLNSWICTKDGRFFRYGGFRGIVNGTKPKTCTRMAINNDGEIFVVDKAGGLYILKFIASNSYLWKQIEKKDIVDVTVGFNNETYVIDTKGQIYGIMKDRKGGKFGKKAYGKGCKSIAVSYENEQIAYVVNKKGDLYRTTAKKSTKLYPSIVVNDVDVDSYNNLFIASGLGLYMKRPINPYLAQIGDGIAKQIDCDRGYCWIIGDDEYVYQSSKLKTW